MYRDDTTSSDEESGSPPVSQNDPSAKRQDIARKNNERFLYVIGRGHREWCQRADLLNNMYMGAGRQWSPQDKDALEAQGRRAIEINEIFDAVNTAIGHQISNRADIAYRPRGNGADDEIATTLSKVAMQVADNNSYSHLETEQFTDGIITGRGWMEYRLDFDQNVRGELRLYVLDYLDAIPDPDGREYDPDTWRDFTKTRWMHIDDIETTYGKKYRKQLEDQYDGSLGEQDQLELEEVDVDRAKFGMETSGSDFYYADGQDVYVRVIDRQHWKLTLTHVAVYPSGDIRIIEDATDGQLKHAKKAGAITYRRQMKRVRWTVSTACDVLLHDDWSPFKHFNIIPFFPFFRKGQVVSLVDNLVGPQEMLNKAASQYLHIINSTANSGWVVEQNSLVNLTVEDLKAEGAKTGLVVEYKKGFTKPEKILPNNVPTGIDKLISLGSEKIRMVSGISDAMRGQAPSSQSGVAIQSLQFGSQMSLSVPIDNLGYSRKLFAGRLLEIIQGFMTEEQLFRITERDIHGQEQTVEIPLNMPQADGSILNDLTLGEYDAIVTSQPSQVTFQNSQFEQAKALKQLIPSFPDSVLIKTSNMEKKSEIIQEMQDRAGAVNPLDEAKTLLAKAQAMSKTIEGLFSAMRTSALLRQDPALAALADEIAKSAGFIDQNPAPIFPAAEAAAAGPPVGTPPTNTNPITPDNPQRGLTTGIEAPGGTP